MKKNINNKKNLFTYTHTHIEKKKVAETAVSVLLKFVVTAVI